VHEVTKNQACLARPVVQAVGCMWQLQ